MSIKHLLLISVCFNLHTLTHTYTHSALATLSEAALVPYYLNEDDEWGLDVAVSQYKQTNMRVCM